MSQNQGNQAKNQNQPKKEPLSQEQILKAWFTPQSQSEDQQNRSKAIRDGFHQLGLIVLKNTQQSADQTAALRKLREASATLVQAISLEEVGK